MKKNMVTLLICLCMLFSFLPPVKVMAEENITMDIGEVVTLTAHGSWMVRSDNGASGYYQWKIWDENIVAGDVRKNPDGKYLELMGLRSGTTEVTLYYREQDVPCTDTWTITVTETVREGVFEKPSSAVSFGILGENVKETITDICQYSGLVDLVAVKRDGLWGFANADMELVIPFQYNSLSTASFADGRYAWVTIGQNQYVIDEQGNYLDLDFHRFYSVTGNYIRGYDATTSYGSYGSLQAKGGEYYKGREKITFQAYDAGILALTYERIKQYIIYQRGELGTETETWYFVKPGDPANGWYSDDDWELTVTVPAGLVNPSNGSKKNVEQAMWEDVLVVRDKVSGKYGVIDHTGKLVIPLEYDKIYNSSGGYLSYQKGKECGLLENPVHPPVKKAVIPATPTPSATPTPVPAGKMPKVGDNVSELIEFRSSFKACGLTGVKINGKYGYVNEDDVLIIPCVYRSVDCFDKTSSLAKVRLSSGKYNVINTEGNPLLKKDYSAVIIFSYLDSTQNPVCAICARNGSNAKGWTNHWFDGNGSPMIVDEDSVAFHQLKASGNASIQKPSADTADKKMPQIGDTVSEQIEYRAALSSCDLTLVRINGKYGYVDENDVLVIPCIFPKAYRFNGTSGLAKVKLSDGKYNVIDTEGNFILPENYEEVTILIKILSTRNFVCAICAQDTPATGERSRCEYWFDGKGELIAAKDHPV